MLEKLKKIGLKIQITSMTLLFCLICISITSTIGVIKSKKALLNLSVEQLQSNSKIISDKTGEYFSNLEIFTDILSKDRLIEGLFIAFEGAFYGGAFSTDKDSQIMTKSYMANEKLYGERIRKTAHDYNMKSIMLVSIHGIVLMNSVLDNDYNFLGRSLKNGLLKDSSLANCYKNAFDSKDNLIFFSDSSYYESSKSIHSFLCQKVLAEFDHADEGIKKGDVLGVIITEIDQEKLNSFLSSREGMGETGQFYLVGEDFKLRSNMRLEENKYNMKNSFLNNIEIKSTSVEAALAGNVGDLEISGLQGHDVLSVYRPISAFGKKWAFIAEKEFDEIFAPVDEMVRFISLVAVGLFFAVSFIVWYSSKLLTRPISDSNNALSHVSENVSTNADVVKKYSEELGNASGSLASSIQETVSTMDEITQMVNKNLDNVELSTDMSESSKVSANEGIQIVSQVLNAMVEIDGTNQKITDEMTDLSEKMVEIIRVIEEIGTKTSVINDIVFQTKLLSFNASVEAARAGEHGKGFAVVAEEVGNLATASGKAATEISQMLHDSVSKVQHIVNTSKEKISQVTSEGKNKIEFGQRVATKCGEQIKSILDNVSKVHQTITEVKMASNEQAIGIREVSKAMQQLDQVSNDTQQISTDILKVANHLAESSDELNHTVNIVYEIIEGKVKNDTIEEVSHEDDSQNTSDDLKSA